MRGNKATLRGDKDRTQRHKVLGAMRQIEEAKGQEDRTL